MPSPGVCVVILGLRRQHQAAVFGRRQDRFTDQSLPATKKANELMAYSYSHLYRLPVTGLRFFTIYGPWGRPDMAIFLFTRSILEGKPIRLFNHGRMRRDFTHIDDVRRVVLRLVDRIPKMAARGIRRHGSTMSAITARKNSCTSSRFWRRSWAARRQRICCRCSPATSWNLRRCRRPDA